MGRRVLRSSIWGYSVCLCPIKRTPGLYGLNTVDLQISTKPKLVQIDISSVEYVSEPMIISEFSEYLGKVKYTIGITLSIFLCNPDFRGYEK